MKKPTFTTNDSPRRALLDAGQPIGWLMPIKQQIQRLKNEVRGLELRMQRRLGPGEPAAVVAKRTFEPESHTFNFDYLQNGASSVSSQYVLRDGVTYEIPIVFPPPGNMLVRFMQVKLYQRVFVPNVGLMQVPMYYGNFFLKNTSEYQTRKFAFPDNTSTASRILMRRASFFWNLIDAKSGGRFSDELVSDQTLLPQGMGLPIYGTSRAYGPTGRFLEFDTPWLFERDGQATFLFRPIMPVIQPTADSGYTPYATFDDREQNGAVRNSAVTVQIELHGTRYIDKQDLLRQGARI